LLGVGAFLAARPAWAAQATLVADAHVNSAMPTVNSGAISNLDVGGGYTTLLQFDLSMLPAGTTAAQVSRAVLRLYVNRVTTSGLVSYAPVTGAWGEYSVTYATEPSIGSPAGVFSVNQAGAFIVVDVTSLVQGWIANPSANNGLALSGGTAMVQFDSKENDQTSHAATLEVDLANQGPAGATGATGPAGPAGAAGAAGLMGPQGPSGATGAAGLQGPIGPAGLTGTTGAPGQAGPMGPQGLTGATGPAGPQGPAGASGTSGAAGLVYQGSYSSTTNYALGDVVEWQGSSYTSLIASNAGNTPSLGPEQWGLLSAQGPVGLTGATGATGSQGPQGLPGSVGPNGPAGPQGLQGIPGQAGAQGIPGTTGATGPGGPMGPQGVPGPVGITFQGTYSSTANYALADGVSYNGAGYVSLVASNHGNTPDQSPQQWALFAAAGASGATGPSGAIGVTGATGAMGPPGLPGPTGATGATGPQGPPVANYLGNYQSSVNYALDDAVSWQGSTYISLIAGNQGNTPSLSPTQWAVLAAQGPTGATGAAGPTGPSGATGLPGTIGAAGPPGPPVTFLGQWLIGTPYAVGGAVAYGGSSYIALLANAGREPDVSPLYWGLLAAAGSIGPAGATGATGLQGPTGYAGQAGPPGSQGPAGPTGVAGATGAPGANGIQGLPGATGAAGATGATGIPGTNGANGTNGAPGPPGMTFRGAWITGYGYAANDAVAFGGSTYLAQVSNSSSEPDLYPQVWAVLAQAGATGPSGPTGTAAAVAIGTVTTGAAGSQAAVTNSGTGSAAVLNFTIPQGAAGPAGSGGSGGGGTSGIPFASMYHAVSDATLYYSVNNINSSATEIGTGAAPASALTWVPSGCTATALNVFSQQTNPITVTLRAGAPNSMAGTTLVCAASPGVAYTASGSVTVPAGSFVDLSITGASGTAAGVWIALACN
jgi:hypothetical protein